MFSIVFSFEKLPIKLNVSIKELVNLNAFSSFWDRKVFNVDQDLTSTGSTALELMEKLPSVEVDIDGNLSLRGSTQVRLYVDGKPSMLSSSDLLETMPSSMIESVELITNPSAKYSPEGMAGIINIVLKKNNKAGLNGNTSFTVGYPARNNFTALLNRRSDKLNLFASQLKMVTLV